MQVAKYFGTIIAVPRELNTLVDPQVFHLFSNENEWMTLSPSYPDTIRITVLVYLIWLWPCCFRDPRVRRDWCWRRGSDWILWQSGSRFDRCRDLWFFRKPDPSCCSGAGPALLLVPVVNINPETKNKNYLKSIFLQFWLFQINFFTLKQKCNSLSNLAYLNH